MATTPILQTAKHDLEAAATPVAALVVSDRLVARSAARNAGRDSHSGRLAVAQMCANYFLAAQLARETQGRVVVLTLGRRINEYPLVATVTKKRPFQFPPPILAVQLPDVRKTRSQSPLCDKQVVSDSSLSIVVKHCRQPPVANIVCFTSSRERTCHSHDLRRRHLRKAVRERSLGKRPTARAVH